MVKSKRKVAEHWSQTKLVHCTCKTLQTLEFQTVEGADKLSEELEPAEVVQKALITMCNSTVNLCRVASKLGKVPMGRSKAFGAPHAVDMATRRGTPKGPILGCKQFLLGGQVRTNQLNFGTLA